MIRARKDTGIRKFPSHQLAQNRAWLAAEAPLQSSDRSPPMPGVSIDT